jgi:hypothetical protein
MNEKVTDRTAKIIALLQERVRLEPFHRRIFYSGFGVLWGSGALWLLIEWFKDPELGGARTLLQTFSMKVHGATMLVYLALLGTLLTHIRRATALKANQLSGFSIIALNGILALSGWFLYYTSVDTFRQWNSTIHWAIGLASLPLLSGHVLLGRGWTTRRVDGNQDARRSRKGINGPNRDNKHRRHYG